MKKLLVITTLLLFAFTLTFAQSDESPFKKNEISIAPYSANLTYFNLLSLDGYWARNRPTYNLLESNYRRYLNENTALRFGGNIMLGGSSGNLSLYGLEVRGGFEKYLTLSPKFQLYGGAQVNLSTYSYNNNETRGYGVGVDLIGGIRYNINDRWSLSSEVIAPFKYNWSSSNLGNSFETGVIWQPVKLNFSF